MNKSMSVVEHADGLMQEAGVLFKANKSIMRSDYRVVAEDQMLHATELRQGIGSVAQSTQAKLYSESARKALKDVEKAIEHASRGA